MNSSNKLNFVTIYKNGNYYNPATSRYRSDVNVTCDRCQKTNLYDCIGWKDHDLCLNCCTVIQQIIESGGPRDLDERQSAMIQRQFTTQTRMEQRQFTTNMEQRQFNTQMEQRQFNTYMKQRQFNTYMEQDQFATSTDMEQDQFYKSLGIDPDTQASHDKYVKEQKHFDTFMEQDQFWDKPKRESSVSFSKHQFWDKSTQEPVTEVLQSTISKHKYITERDKKKAEDEAKWKKEKESWGPEMYQSLMMQNQFTIKNKPTNRTPWCTWSNSEEE